MLRVLGYSEQENPTFQSHPPELALWEFLVLWVKDTKFWPSQLNWSLPLFFLLGSSKEIFAGGKDELNWKGARTQSKNSQVVPGMLCCLLGHKDAKICKKVPRASRARLSLLSPPSGYSRTG